MWPNNLGVGYSRSSSTDAVTGSTSKVKSIVLGFLTPKFISLIWLILKLLRINIQ